MSISGKITPPSAPWVRPTACSIPHPPRRRTTPIAFATSAFDPCGWSVPPTPAVTETETGLLDAVAVHNALLEATAIDAPKIAYAVLHTGGDTNSNINSKPPHPPRKRTEPVGFAKAAFDPRGWTPSSRLSPTPSFASLSSEGTEEVIESPTDSILLDRPVMPSRSGTEPIGFASNTCNVPLKAPLPAVNKPAYPPSPPSSVFDGWSPVYAADLPAPSMTPRKPCTKWMKKSLALPVSYKTSLKEDNRQAPQTIITVTDECEYNTKTFKHDLLKAERTPHRRSDSNDSDITIRPCTYQDPRPASAAAGPSGASTSSTSSKWLEHKVQLDQNDSASEQDEEIVLREIPVSNLHPSIARLSRRSTTRPVPRDINKTAITLGLRPSPGMPRVADTADSQAMPSLAQAMEKLEQAENVDAINLNRLEDDLLRIHETEKGKLSHSPVCSAEIAAETSSAESATREFHLITDEAPATPTSAIRNNEFSYVPSAPRSSPSLRAKENHSPIVQLDVNSDPFANWSAPIFRQDDGGCNLDLVSAKLRQPLMESFNVLGSNGDDFYHSNKAEKGPSGSQKRSKGAFAVSW